MRIEIDQSGRIEFTATDTVLAVRKYRIKKKVGKTFFIKLFSACIFLLIKDIIHKLDEIVIDVEFERKEKDIKNILMNYIRKTYPNFDKHKILFQRISKKSNAHKLAVEVFRDKRIENRVIKREEIEALL